MDTEALVKSYAGARYRPAWGREELARAGDCAGVDVVEEVDFSKSDSLQDSEQ